MMKWTILGIQWITEIKLWRWNGVLTPHPYELHPIIPDKCFLFGLGVSHSISRMSDATPPHKRVMAILFLTIVTK